MGWGSVAGLGAKASRSVSGARFRAAWAIAFLGRGLSDLLCPHPCLCLSVSLGLAHSPAPLLCLLCPVSVLSEPGPSLSYLCPCLPVPRLGLVVCPLVCPPVCPWLCLFVPSSVCLCPPRGSVSHLCVPVPVLSSHWLQVGSFFMINLCLVVIATQFSETKQREHRLMLEQRQRYLSSSTVASYAEPGDCYEEIFQYVCHILRKAKRRALGLYQALQSRRQAPGTGGPTPAKPEPPAKEPRHCSKWPRCMGARGCAVTLLVFLYDPPAQGALVPSRFWPLLFPVVCPDVP